MCIRDRDVRGHHEGVRPQLAGEHSRGEVLVDNGLHARKDVGPAPLRVAREHRRYAAPAGADDHAPGAQEQVNRSNLEDPQGFWLSLIHI